MTWMKGVFWDLTCFFRNLVQVMEVRGSIDNSLVLKVRMSLGTSQTSSHHKGKNGSVSAEDLEWVT